MIKRTEFTTKTVHHPSPLTHIITPTPTHTVMHTHTRQASKQTDRQSDRQAGTDTPIGPFADQITALRPAVAAVAVVVVAAAA